MVFWGGVEKGVKKKKEVRERDKSKGDRKQKGENRWKRGREGDTWSNA